MATGFEVVARRPALIVIPLLLDVFLWLGPRLSIVALFLPFKQMLLQDSSGVAAWLGTTAWLDAIGELWQILSTRVNLFGFLHAGPIVGVPALMLMRMPAECPLAARLCLEVTSWPVMVLLSLALPLLGLGLSAGYLRALGIAVIEETQAALPGPEMWFDLWKRMVWTWGLLFLIFLLLAALGTLLVGFVSLSLVTFLVLWGQLTSEMLVSAVVAPAGVLIVVALSQMLLVGMYLLFVVPGVVQLRRSPVQAIKESLLLTRTHAADVFTMVSCLMLVALGANAIWTLPDPGSWTALAGLGGHAFVSTALTATIFVFYQDRLGFLPAPRPAWKKAVIQTPAAGD